MRRRQTALLAAGGVAVGILAGCGNTVTANRDFQTLSVSVTINVKQNGSSLVKETAVGGVMLDAKGTRVPGSRFIETCAQGPATGSQQWRCLTLLNTGDRLYVAGGLTDAVFGKQRMLDRANSTGSMTITEVRETPIPPDAGTVPAGAKAYILKVSLRK